MAMSRKHYREVADIIKSVHQDYGHPADSMTRLAMQALAGRMAVMFKGDNSNFDRQKFMEACGFDN